MNFSQNAERRFKFAQLIDRDTDLQAARALIESTIQDLPFVLDTPAASVWIETLGTTGAKMVLTGWVDQIDTSAVLAKGDAIRQVKRALLLADVALPDSPQTVIAKRANTTRPVPPETAAVTTVTTKADTTLARIVEAERNETGTHDLLREDAQKE